MKVPSAVFAALLAGLAAAPIRAGVVISDGGGTVAVPGKHGINLSNDKLRHDNITVGKGETLKGDLVTSGAIDIQGVVEGSCVSLGGHVNVSGEVRGDVVALGGPIDLAGSSKRDLVAIGGSVRVSGKVGGELTAIGGDVSLGKGSVVKGDVSVVGGHLDKEDGATIKGSVSQIGLGAIRGLIPALTRGGLALALAAGDDREKGSHFGKRTGDEDEIPVNESRAHKAGVSFAFIAGIGIVLSLAGLLFPREIEKTAAAIREDFWKSAVVGTLVAILFIPGLIVLSVSILGIPLVPFAVLLWCAAALFGVAAFSHVIAERAMESFQKPLPSAPLAVAAGWVVIELLPFVGQLIGGFIGGTLVFAGILLLSGGLVAGLGAVWNTRFGRKAWIA